jgi:hypothetical protein
MTAGSPPPNPESPESRLAAKLTNAIIRWTPIGGGGGLMIHSLLKQEWIQAGFMFPVMLAAAVWAAYTENFIETFSAIAGDRGRNDAQSLSQRLARLNKVFQWRFSKADDRYRVAQANACKYYLVEGVNRSWNRGMVLEEVFVPLKLSGRLGRGFFQGDFEGVPLDGAELGLEQAKKQKSCDIWDLLRQMENRPDYRQMAIIAPGGSGKTTLLRYVAYRYGSDPHRLCREKQVPRLVPILLYLRECRERIAQDDAPDLPGLIAEFHVPRLSKKLVGLDVDWAEKLLSSGKALVMIDGFDEVAESQCEQVSQWIDQAIADYGKTTAFILTTRPAGDERYEGQQPLKRVEVEKFSDEDRDLFLQRWYFCQIKNDRLGNDSDGAEDEAAREAADLIEQIEQRSELAELADTPLLLCMMASYHKNNPVRSLPLVRHRLYQGFCRMLLEDRPQSKKIAMLLPAEESQPVLQRVALAMVQQDRIALSLEDMAQLIEQSLVQCIEASGGAMVLAGEFVKQMEEVSELFVRQQASDEYEFAHRSFQEYLAAAEVKQRNEPSLLVALSKEWRDTAVLYAAQTNPTSLIEQLCDQASDQANQQTSEEALNLAYDCWLENRQAVPPKTFARLQELCYAQLEQYMVAGDWKAADMYNYRLMIQVLGKRYGHYFTAEELMTFPCADLLRIDGLWVRHSGGKFGFSVQKDIYVNCGGLLDGKYSEEPFVKFIQQVGWCKEDAKRYDTWKELAGDSALREYSNFIFSSEKALGGHLPLIGWVFRFRYLLSLFSHPDL